MKISHIIFDLDGTLIDSADSILTTFKHAFNSVHIKPYQDLTTDAIGPPLSVTLAQLAGPVNQECLDEIEQLFKAYYDKEGYRQTLAFPGVAEMLEKLASNGWPLYIATNKRISPTRKIISHLGWAAWFCEVYALDSFGPVFADKEELLGYIIQQQNLNPLTTLYIGDRFEDGQAAEFNRMPFVLADWGYADNQRSHIQFLGRCLAQPLDILSLLGID
jgi:phosphoglycolate phosphatase